MSRPHAIKGGRYRTPSGRPAPSWAGSATTTAIKMDVTGMTGSSVWVGRAAPAAACRCLGWAEIFGLGEVAVDTL